MHPKSTRNSSTTPRRNYHTGPRARTVEERFWQKVRKGPACWEWTGCIGQRDNSGVFRLNNRKVPAHAAAWILSNGPISTGARITHKCGNPRCVRPDHLTLSTPESRLWDYVEKLSSGCWVWRGNVGGEAGRIQFRGRLDSPYRVAWILTNGEIPDGLYVCHHCDNPPCCNPAHLFLGTPTDNVRDCISKGRHCHGDRHWMRRHPERVKRGEKIHCSKLTADQVIEMRRQFSMGVSTKAELARQYGVAHHTVSTIVARKQWAHL